jgi:hypothetical protein
MSIKTKIKIKNGRWEINGKRLDDFLGDRDLANSLLMTTIRINQIHDVVDERNFANEIPQKTSKNFLAVISTVNRTLLKQQNHRFKKQYIDFPLFDEYPNIETISFTRKLGEE